MSVNSSFQIRSFFGIIRLNLTSVDDKDKIIIVFASKNGKIEKKKEEKNQNRDAASQDVPCGVGAENKIKPDDSQTTPNAR